MQLNFMTAEAGVRKISEDIVNSDTLPTVNIPVIFARQNAPRPQSDYITVDTLAVTPVGRPQIIADEDNTDKYKIIQDVTAVISFAAYGKTANNLLSRLNLHINGNPIILDRFIVEAGVAPTGSASQRDLTVLLESGYEPRAVMDVVFNGALIEDNVDLGIIESVEISEITYEAAYPHGDGDVQWTSTLTVDPYNGG